MNSLITYLKKQSFVPGFLSIFINPFYFIRRALYKGIRQEAAVMQRRMMDFGCGRKPYESLFQVKEYIGIDIEVSGHDHTNSKVDVFYDGKTIPFPDGHFDSVFCGEVMEHVFMPDDTLREIRRVLKPGANLLMTVPFCWNEHEVPYDYARYSSFGIRSLLEKNGFQVLRVNKTGNFARVVFQLTALYFFEFFKKYGRGGYLLALLFIIPVNILGVILLPLMPKNDSLFFNSIVVAQKAELLQPA